MIRDYHSGDNHSGDNHPADTAALAALFRSAVLQTAASHYSPEQVAVWSSLVEDLAQFQRRLSLGVTRVAVVQQQPAAFGQLYPNDHIEFLYTDSRFARQGYATLVYQQLEAEAIARGVSKLRTEASHIAQHFFLKMGFELLELETVERAGLLFERFKMQKRLPLSCPEVERKQSAEHGQQQNAD